MEPNRQNKSNGNAEPVGPSEDSDNDSMPKLLGNQGAEKQSGVFWNEKESDSDENIVTVNNDGDDYGQKIDSLIRQLFPTH